MKKKSMTVKMLNTIETVGNKLPDPITIFVILSVIVVGVSSLLEMLGVSVTFTGINRSTLEVSEQTVAIRSLMSNDSIEYMFTTAVKNFVNFAPLGVVLVAMLGVGVADGSGYITALLKKVVLASPKSIITPVVVFAAVMSNLAADAGYVILIPLGAIIFQSFGKHPIAGIAAAFAGVSGGFSANLLVSPTDPLLGGISTEAARILDPTISVGPTDNWFFLVVSTFFVVIVGTIITEKIVEPALGEYKPEKKEEANKIEDFSLTEEEKTGLTRANFSILLTLLFFIYLAVDMGLPGSGALVGESGFLTSSFIKAVIIIITIFFFVPGVVFGFATKKFKNDKDVVLEMSKSMSSMGEYLVLSFFAAQFISYFSYSNIGTVLAVQGADFLENMSLSGAPLFVGFIIIAAIINLFIGSASAKWAIMAPVFVPMLMRLGYDPSLTQMAYRIADSSTNIITPLMVYFPIVIIFAKRYETKNNPIGIGTLTSMMLPYSIAFLIGWTVLFLVWMGFGLPMGPGVPLEYTIGQ